MPQHADVHRQLLLLLKLAVGVPRWLADVRVFHPGHSFAMQGIDHAENSVAQLLRGWIRNKLEHRVHGGFFEHAGGNSLGIAVDGPGRRIFRLGVDMRQPQRFMIGHAVVSGGMHQPDWIVRRCLIQVGGQYITALRQLAFVPARTGEPLPWLQLCGRRVDAIDHLADGGGITETDFVELLVSAGRKMGVGIDQSRRRGLSMKIDDFHLQDR